MAKKKASRKSNQIWDVKLQLENGVLHDTYWVRATGYQAAITKAVRHQRIEHGLLPGRPHKFKVLRVELAGTIDVE